MTSIDLRDFIGQLEEVNEIQEVLGADWNLEIGTITELMSEREGPALLFDRIKGYLRGYRVVTSLISTPRRLAAALGLPLDIPALDVVRLVKERFETLKPTAPVWVHSGPVEENALEGEEVDLLCFPAPKWHEKDGGRYLGTGCMVIMKDPDSDWVNVGTYRVQLHDQRTLGVYISPGHQGRWIREQYWAREQNCPVVVVFGCHPILWMPSFLALPWGTSEYAVAGGLLGRPAELIRGRYTDLPIPAHAEIAVEGEIPPVEVESRSEGPFGEWTGYYASGARNEAVIKVKRVIYRTDPIILGAPPLRPPGHAHAPTYLLAAANIWNELERVGVPDIRGVWQLRAGSRRYLTVISIRQRYAGHAKQAAMAAMSGPEGAYHGRFVVVVDDDIDPSQTDDVLWAMATRCDPATSIEIIRDCWSTPLDPIIHPDRRARQDFTNSRAVILACKPFSWYREFPLVNRASDNLRQAVLKKWQTLFA
ncbi:MAG: UbiD family decarboxylase [Candidatus Binatia bacterium]